jgi:uncharacterized protein YjbI with pentapeptide repeats
LEAGLPQKLSLTSYIRLLPFNRDQVAKFFEKYRLPGSFDILKSYNLTEEEIFKPLFCWMFAIMRNSKSDDITLVFKDFDSHAKRSVSRALVYQGFIHSIIRGKFKDEASKYSWTGTGEEKRILRKIAALRQMHNPLRKSMVIDGLKNYDISYDEAKLEDVLDPILTSYFHLQSTTAFDISMDFIHKSFREYLLAEYYLESITNNKRHYLNAGVPSPETISFLDGLLELLLENNDENLKEYANILTKSLFYQTNQQDNLSQSDVTQILWKNAQRYYEEEQIIFHTKPHESDQIWFKVDFPISKYAELWIHRWLSLYVLNKLALGTRIDKKALADFIVKTSNTIPQLQMRLNKVDLSGQFLKNTMLIGANLSGANLSRVDLSGANLSRVDLSGADLSSAYLSSAYLFGADLSEAYISYVQLSYACLFSANISHANLSRANLSGADLSHVNLSGADLSHVNLSYTNLSDAYLSYATLSSANLSDADLSYADLSGANLFGANLSAIKTDNRTNFKKANLTSAYPSSVVTDIAARSIGRKSNVKSLSVDTESSIHKITRYTSDGKPINQ